MGSAYRVYVLKNPSGRFYIGVTANVEQRLAEHNAGRSRWTKSLKSWVPAQ
jgi:predicted GIY-YIG superfamily endonuclease